MNQLDLGMYCLNGDYYNASDDTFHEQNHISYADVRLKLEYC